MSAALHAYERVGLLEDENEKLKRRVAELEDELDLLAVENDRLRRAAEAAPPAPPAPPSPARHAACLLYTSPSPRDS